MPWLELETKDQLNWIIKASRKRPQLIYKHSTRCHTCTDILDELNRDFNALEDQAAMIYLDLLQFRDVSTEIATHFGISHQSPQLILLYKGKAVFHAEHWDIKPEEIQVRLKKINKN